MTDNIIYQANIHSGNDIKFYFGSTENFWKVCFYHHKMTLKNVKYKHSTALNISGN